MKTLNPTRSFHIGTGLRSVVKMGMALMLIAMVPAAQAVITGSAHDFSGKGWNPSGEICVVCHTPHNAQTAVPLWNHETTTASFTLYGNSATLDATDVSQPAGVSKLCLSCHDGTVAVDNFGGTTTGTKFVTGGKLLGTDLSNDHPISFTYNDALATTDGALHPPTTSASGLGGNIDADMLFGTASDKLECASCHDVHNAANIGKLLRVSNASSALCLTCHAK